jgi:hypothetical protein
MEKGNEHNFTSKQEFKSFFSPMASFSWENKKKVQGKGFELLEIKIVLISFNNVYHAND